MKRPKQPTAEQIITWFRLGGVNFGLHPEGLKVFNSDALDSNVARVIKRRQSEILEAIANEAN